MKAQASIETLMTLAASIAVLSLLLGQISMIEKTGEKVLSKKETKEAETLINSICKVTAASNSKQEAVIYFFKNASIEVSNDYCEKKSINLSKGKNKIVFYPSKPVKIMLKLH